jgi:hypothetical protein
VDTATPRPFLDPNALTWRAIDGHNSLDPNSASFGIGGPDVTICNGPLAPDISVLPDADRTGTDNFLAGDAVVFFNFAVGLRGPGGGPAGCGEPTQTGGPVSLVTPKNDALVASPTPYGTGVNQTGVMDAQLIPGASLGFPVAGNVLADQISGSPFSCTSLLNSVGTGGSLVVAVPGLHTGSGSGGLVDATNAFGVTPL